MTPEQHAELDRVALTQAVMDRLGWRAQDDPSYVREVIDALLDGVRRTTR